MEIDMRHPKLTIAVVGIAVAAGAGGIAAAATTGGSTTKAAAAPSVPGAAASPVTPGSVPSSSSTVRTANVNVDGVNETILVDANGLPLYTYKLDTATRSLVTGSLATLWPPLVSAHPTISGASGRLTVTNNANGAQVAYNGHFLYTFVNDSPGRVTGQAVQDFFVAPPGLAPIGGAPPSPAPTPAPGSGGSFGY
jgi:predicted lipoprotein with Yx(FWY)xxD motif